jgi:cytochrome c6
MLNFARMSASVLGTVLLIAALWSPARADVQGPSLYRSKCAVCHGATGKGDTPAGKSMGVPDLTKSAAKSVAELKAVIEQGRNKMPAYGKSLKPAEIADLIGYIKTLK